MKSMIVATDGPFDYRGEFTDEEAALVMDALIPLDHGEIRSSERTVGRVTVLTAVYIEILEGLATIRIAIPHIAIIQQQ